MIRARFVFAMLLGALFVLVAVLWRGQTILEERIRMLERQATHQLPAEGGRPIPATPSLAPTQ